MITLSQLRCFFFKLTSLVLVLCAQYSQDMLHRLYNKVNLLYFCQCHKKKSRYSKHFFSVADPEGNFYSIATEPTPPFSWSYSAILPNLEPPPLISYLLLSQNYWLQTGWSITIFCRQIKLRTLDVSITNHALTYLMYGYKAGYNCHHQHNEGKNDPSSCSCWQHKTWIKMNRITIAARLKASWSESSGLSS